MSLPRYTKWDDVPEHLKTKTKINKMGLRLARNQSPAGIKAGGYGPFYLYDVRLAVPKRQPTQKQLAALEKGRVTMRRNRGCRECFRSWREARIVDGVCVICIRKRNHRIEAIRQARQWLADPKVVLIDVETTGWDGVVIEACVANCQGDILLEQRWYPLLPIEDGAFRVHGISLTDLMKEPHFRDSYIPLRDLLIGHTVVAYNKKFELERLAMTCLYAEIDDFTPGISAECLMEVYADFVGDDPPRHGTYRYRWQRLPHGDHSAKGDVNAMIQLLERLANMEEE